MNIVCYIATAFQAKSLFKLRSDFINYYFTESGAIAFRNALEKIHMHQNNGHKVLIISGCPHWLLTGVTRYIGIRNVLLISSEFKLFMTGVLLHNHCYSSNKINMAIHRGLHIENWDCGYSDSTADIPMLTLVIG